MTKLETVNIDDENEVLALVKELTERGERAAKLPRLVGERNEIWYSGDQFVDIRPSSQTIEDAWQTALPTYAENQIRNAVDTLTARMLKDRPSVTTFPASADPSDAAA